MLEILRSCHDDTSVRFCAYKWPCEKEFLIGYLTTVVVHIHCNKVHAVAIPINYKIVTGLLWF